MDLTTLFGKLCALLARYIDASVVFIALRDADNVTRIKHLYDHGATRPADAPLLAGSRSAEVMSTGKSLLLGSFEDWGQRIPPDPQGERSDDSISAIFVPLRFGSETLGVLSVQSLLPDAYSEEDLAVLEMSALYVAVGIFNARLASEKALLEELAAHDALTSLANRRKFDETLRTEWNRALRSGESLAVIMLDVDFFKDFNDNYGHPAGDACLQQVAQVIASVAGRAGDFAARYGGEEFAIILPSTDVAGAVTLAETMTTEVSALQIPHERSSLGFVTVSLGVAARVPAFDELSSTLLDQADKFLYRAKEQGRNRWAAEAYDVERSSAMRKVRVRQSLPVHLTRFLGRASELAELTALLSSARVVTVTGPGGIGKTRLALQASEAMAPQYPAALCFVDISGLNDPSLLESTVGDALGFREKPSRSYVGALVEYLADRRALLVIDNCEHMIGACAALVETLAANDTRLTILTTSREPLAIEGEQVFRVPGLEVDEAVALFTERANAAGGRLSDETARSHVAEICRRLDGIPLAIELAAARTPTLSLPQLEKMLEARLTLLTEGSRTAVPRHRTLRALIDWSYDLLSSEEQMALQRLAVFASEFTLEDACAVCACDAIPRERVLEHLAQLVAKSLVNAEERDGERYYRLLETTREYAFAYLEASGTRREVQRQHLAHHLALALDAEARFQQMSREAWLSGLAHSVENFRAALRWSVGERNAAEDGAHLAATLTNFWLQRGELDEAEHWLHESLRVARLGDLETRGAVAYGLQQIAYARGDYPALAKHANEALAIFTKLGRAGFAVKARGGVASAQLNSGDYESARLLYQANLDACRASDDLVGVALTLGNLAMIASDALGQYAQAIEIYSESLAYFRGLHHDRGVAMVLGDLGEVHAYAGHYDKAVEYSEQSVVIFERLGLERETAWNYGNLGAHEIARGHFDDARSFLRQALRVHQRALYAKLRADCFDACAHLAHATGRLESTARLAAFAHIIRAAYRVEMLPALRDRHEQWLDGVRAAFGPALFAEHWKRGGEFQAEAAFEEALTL